MLLFIEGARTGGKVISIRTDQEDIQVIKHILEQENALGVSVLQMPEFVRDPR